MRKLVYDCYFNKVKMKTVSTLKEAKEWKDTDANNTVKEKLIDWTDKKEETKEEREKRIATMNKRIKAIKEKSKKRNNAAVV